MTSNQSDEVNGMDETNATDSRIAEAFINFDVEPNEFPIVGSPGSDISNNSQEYVPTMPKFDMDSIKRDAEIMMSTTGKIVASTVLSPRSSIENEGEESENEMSLYKWDGSYLGQYTKSVIDWKLETKRSKYCQLNIDGEVTICEIKSVKSHIPCVVDEIKPYFGLKKLGTHDLHIGKTLYQIIKATLPSLGGLQEDYRLDEIVKIHGGAQNLPEELISQVRKIYIFRNILGISQSFDRSIRIRLEDNVMIPISFTENKMEPDINKPISKVAIKKWFDGNDMIIPDILFEMLSIDDVNEIEYTIPIIRSEIDKVIKRIDRNLVILNSLLTRNIQKYIYPRPI